MDQIRDTDFNLFAYLPFLDPSTGKGVDIVSRYLFLFDWLTRVEIFLGGKFDRDRVLRLRRLCRGCVASFVIWIMIECILDELKISISEREYYFLIKRRE